MKKGKKVQKKLIRKTKVKKKRKMDRIPSGIDGLDELVEGGLDKSSVNLVVGDSGCGKTIFALQFLIEGLRRGEKCLFVTFEEKKNEFYDNMMNFGWDLAKYEKEGNFFFLEYHPEKVKVMIEEGGGEIEAIISKNKISRLVIDSITSFALLFEDELEKREAALALFDIIRKWNVTSLLTLQENPVERKGGEASGLEFEADSIILLYFIRQKKRRQRFIEVLKMRGTRHSHEIHVLKITKSGIVVSEEIYTDGIK
jgi:circadian clock protein KaiC